MARRIGDLPQRVLKIVNYWLGEKIMEQTNSYDSYIGANFIEQECNKLLNIFRNIKYDELVE